MKGILVMFCKVASIFSLKQKERLPAHSGEFGWKGVCGI